MTIVVLGASGFIGRSVVDHGRSRGIDVAGLRAPRIAGTCGPAAEAAEQWRRMHPGEFEALCAALEPFDVVVNAAGAATPAAPISRVLIEANAVLPGVVALAAAAAGVRRLVHVSTASVQGRLDPLDETPRTLPLSPYARSKADGEAVLTARSCRVAPLEIVLYRPTGVQGVDRSTTRNLHFLARSLPFVVVAGRGEHAVPASLIENVAAGLLFAATMVDPPPIVLQPWEGLTTGRLLRVFGARRILELPTALVALAMGTAARLTARSPVLTARLRRVELVVQGQGMRATALAAAGFEPPGGVDAWEALAAQLADGRDAGSPAVDQQAVPADDSVA